MLRHARCFLLALGVISAVVQPVLGDDKDLLKSGDASGTPPNLLIVFGNSQTMTQTLSFTGVNFSTFDGDADSPRRKVGAAKHVIKQFVFEKHPVFNLGLTTFSHQPNIRAIAVGGKHWIHTPVAVDFPAETWGQPNGTLERWGVK